jgi:hypothetical protein
MADITKCEDTLCPSKETCYRYTAPASEHWQSYGKFNREEDEDNCDMYWDNKPNKKIDDKEFIELFKKLKVINLKL